MSLSGSTMSVPSALHVAERCKVELERSKSPGEGDLLIATEVLTGENEKRVLEPRSVEIVPRRVVQRGEPDARHYRAECRVERFDVECACHAGLRSISKSLKRPNRGYRTLRRLVKPTLRRSFIEKKFIRN